MSLCQTKEVCLSLSSLLSILGTLLVLAPFVQIQPSLRPSKSGLFQYVSSMYSSSLACVTTIISTSTTSHSLLLPYLTCFARDCLALVFSQTVCIQLATGGFGHTSHTAFTYPRPSLCPTYRHPLTPMLELFWSRLSGLLHFLATNCWLQNAITPSQIVSSWPYFWPASSGIAIYMGHCPQ